MMSGVILQGTVIFFLKQKQADRFIKFLQNVSQKKFVYVF